MDDSSTPAVVPPPHTTGQEDHEAHHPPLHLQHPLRRRLERPGRRLRPRHPVQRHRLRRTTITRTLRNRNATADYLAEMEASGYTIHDEYRIEGRHPLVPGREFTARGVRGRLRFIRAVEHEERGHVWIDAFDRDQRTRSISPERVRTVHSRTAKMRASHS